METSFDRWTSLAGTYHYHRIGYDERVLKLLPYGTIGEGSGAAERLWRVGRDKETLQLSIYGDYGEICRLRQEPDGCWRGQWLRFERMPIELVPQRLQPLRSFEDRGSIAYERHRFHYISYAQLVKDCHDLARRLPPVRAIAGIPRSGLAPASILALDLNAPMVSLEALLSDDPLAIPVPRRGYGRRTQDGIVLVVDDTSASGRQVTRLQSLIRHPVQYAAIYVEDRPTISVDYYHSVLPNYAQFYEWTMFHDDNNRRLLTDLDGVLCDDWSGGNEDANAEAYLDFLRNARPRRIPSIPVKGIVTNRLERHRQETEAWLAKHKVDYGFLAMSPYDTFVERDRANDAAARKARLYADDPDLRLFVESDDALAQEIARLTGRPVFSIARNGLIGG